MEDVATTSNATSNFLIICCVLLNCRNGAPHGNPPVPMPEGLRVNYSASPDRKLRSRANRHALGEQTPRSSCKLIGGSASGLHRGATSNCPYTAMQDQTNYSSSSLLAMPLTQPKRAEEVQHRSRPLPSRRC